jgi:hypothetical protein
VGLTRDQQQHVVEIVEEEDVSRRRVILRVGRRAALVMIGAAFAIQIVRPARTNPPTDPARTLTTVADVPAGAHDVLVRGCQDCHSNDTRWPWYSNVAPISWFVIDHVNHGRRHFNYSDWAQYDRDRIPGLLKDICELTRKGDMPMSSYLWLHPDSRLTDTDVTVLCEWTDGMRRVTTPTSRSTAATRP